MLPFKKKPGDMHIFCVYFQGKVSNNLLQENYSAVMSGCVSMVIRKQFFADFSIIQQRMLLYARVYLCFFIKMVIVCY